jgi:hypothetical protein
MPKSIDDLDQVAVIVVHGVADQNAGDTMRSLVDLLVSSVPDVEPEVAEGFTDEQLAALRVRKITYEEIGARDFAIKVPPLDPRNPPPARVDGTPEIDDRSFRKALAQSWHSDLHRDGWRVSIPRDESPQTTELLKEKTKRQHDDDRGIVVSNYLLTKNRDNGATSESFASQRVDMIRYRDGEPTTRLAVYEMYWADLSRLSGALPRIIAELFTIVFRMSKLGRATIEEACASSHLQKPGPSWWPGSFRPAWRTVRLMQRLLDWIFVNFIALAFAQLLMLEILIAAWGAVVELGESRAALLDKVAVAALVGLALLYIGYRISPKKLWWPLLATTIAAVIFVWFHGRAFHPWITVVLPILFVVAGYVVVLRVSEDRFPFIRPAGLGMTFVVGCLFVYGIVLHVPEGRDAYPLFAAAALFVVEVVLTCVQKMWVVVGVLLMVWLLATYLAALDRRFESRASLATGRLGFSVSLGAFLVMSMVLWAMTSDILDLSASKLSYTPEIFEVVLESPKSIDEHLRVAQTPTGPTVRAMCRQVSDECGKIVDPKSSAQLFLKQRYDDSTIVFSVLAVLFIVMVTYLAITLLPSVLAELKILVNRRRDAAAKQARRQVAAGAHAAARPRAAQAAQQDEATAKTRRLGRWLTLGYRNLDTVVLLISLCVLAISITTTLAFFPGIGDLLDSSGYTRLFEEGMRYVRGASQVLLRPLVFSAATFFVALSLFGSFLSKRLPAIRGPLDVALDVDNHFREFPRSSIARARIFSRYVALLQHVRAQGFKRVVIVAHSQGTVITAELLRYLSSNGREAPKGDARPDIGGGHEAFEDIRLLTLGCPLRQLYSARFPTLYRWVLARHRNGEGQEIDGPQAKDIGVDRWTNAFCSGDYVGRWLWSAAAPGDPIGHPMADTTHLKPLGRADAYGGFDPMPPLAAAMAASPEVEVCLGLGAHTHYLEREQTTVAYLIDHLVVP